MIKIPLKVILRPYVIAKTGPSNSREFFYVDHYEPFEYEGKMWKVIELYDDHTMLVEEIIDDSKK